MTQNISHETFHTIVIGGGQTGLSVGYYLASQGRSFVILDASQRVGDVWRQRWDSLRLFTPAAFDGLGVGRKVFLHINNSNRALLPDTAERAHVSRAGWEIPADGTEIIL